MNSHIFTSLENLLEELESDPDYLRFLELKKEIRENTALQEKIKEFRSMEDVYSSYYVSKKREILEDPLVLSYHALDKKFRLLAMNISKQLKELL